MWAILQEWGGECRVEGGECGGGARGSGVGHGPLRLMCWSEMLRPNCQLKPDSEVSDVTKGVRGPVKGRWLRSCGCFLLPSLPQLQVRLKVDLTSLYRKEGDMSSVIFAMAESLALRAC